MDNLTFWLVTWQTEVWVRPSDSIPSRMWTALLRQTSTVPISAFSPSSALSFHEDKFFNPLSLSLLSCKIFLF